jgi:hypothetical protein
MRHQHGFHHLPIGLEPGFPLAVIALQAAHVRVHLGEPQFHDTVRHDGEYDV